MPKLNMFRPILFILFLLLATPISLSQNRQSEKIVISGTVYGYSFDPQRKILKKESGVVLEGTLSSVNLVAKSDNKVIQTVKANQNGEFTIVLPLQKNLTLEYSKANYLTSSFEIDLGNVSPELQKQGLLFTNVELLLNSFIVKDDESGRPFGTLSFDNTRNALTFKEIVYDDKKKLFGDNKDNSPMNLMNQSIKKNASANFLITTENQSNEQTNKTSALEGDKNANKTNEATNEVKTSSKLFSQLSKFELNKINNTDLQNRETEIQKAWEQLEKDKLLAVTPEDFLIIQAREDLLIAAEKELDDARKYIALQESEISSQQTKLVWMFAALLILLVSLFLIVRYAKQKAKLNTALAAKNKKITESINYALRIQQSVLFTEEQVAKLLPDSFILYQPLDIVSGDFYWVSKVDNKIIVAVIDCTGHGVPGAFMSLIGNTLLNQIINEKRIVGASTILAELNEGIIEALRQKESEINNQDGMDMSLCVIDTAAKKVEFAGAMNPIYLVKNKEVITLEASLRAIGGITTRKKSKDFTFESQTIQLEKNDAVYLTSDGYMDQFGGKEKTKFNLPQFKSLLLSVENKSMRDQKSIFDKTLKDWRGTEKQIDDILVVGFRL